MVVGICDAMVAKCTDYKTSCIDPAATYQWGKNFCPYGGSPFRHIRRTRSGKHAPSPQRWSLLECHRQTPFGPQWRSSSVCHPCCSSCSPAATEWLPSESVHNNYKNGMFVISWNLQLCVNSWTWSHYNYAPLFWNRHGLSRAASCGHSWFYKLLTPSQHFRLYRKWCTRNHLQTMHHYCNLQPRLHTHSTDYSQ